MSGAGNARDALIQSFVENYTDISVSPRTEQAGGAGLATPNDFVNAQIDRFEHWFFDRL